MPSVVGQLLRAGHRCWWAWLLLLLARAWSGGGNTVWISAATPTMSRPWQSLRRLCASALQSLHRYRLGSAGFRCHRGRPPLGPFSDRTVRAPPLVSGTNAGKTDRDRDVARGEPRQGCVHFESILVRGLMYYTFCAPNGSPEYRYCLHESVEECNHTMMFQEMVNRIGLTPPVCRGGCAGYRRAPLCGAAPEHLFLRGPWPARCRSTTRRRHAARWHLVHPIVENIIAIHVAEEARHISFAHEFLRKRVPNLLSFSRFWLSLFVPLVMADRPGDRGAVAPLLHRIRHSAPGTQRPAIQCAILPPTAARHVRRRANALP